MAEVQALLMQVVVGTAIALGLVVVGLVVLRHWIRQPRR